MQDTDTDERRAAVVPHVPDAAYPAAPPAEPPTRRRWLVLVAVLVVGALALALLMRDGGPRDPAVSYVTESARTADLQDVVEGTTTLVLAADAQALATAPGAGVVTTVHVGPGDTPAALDPVVAIDGNDLHAIPGEAPLHRPLAEGDEGDDVQTLEAALEAGGHDPGEVDEVFDADTAAALTAWQEEIGIDETGTLDPTTVLWLPTGAEVLTVEVTLGEQVVAGQPLVSTGVTRDLVAEVELDQADVVDVTVGDRVTIDIDGLDEEIDGTVDRIAALPTGPDGTYVVDVTAAGWPDAALVGMTGGVEIVTGVIRDAVVVPTGVIGGTAAQPTVPVLVDGEPVDTPVQLGLVTATETQVVSGLQAGAPVVLGEEGGA